MKKNKLLSIFTVATLAVGFMATPLYQAGVETASAATYTRASGYTYQIDEDLKGSPDSFEAWIKVPTNSTGGTIMGNAHNDYSRNGAYAYNTVNWEVSPDGYMRVEWADSATQLDTAYDTANDIRGAKASLAHTFTGTTSLKDNKWHHVAIVRTATAFTYYLDGVKASTYTVNSSPAVSTHQMFIGTDASGWVGEKTPFNGSIAQVTVWEGSITESQIKADCAQRRSNANLYPDYANYAITQADDISPNAELMGNWYLGREWTKEVVKNTCIGGPNATLSTCETFVDVDMPTADEYDYCFVAIPDIQTMARHYPERIKQAMNWLVDNKDTYNVQFVMQLGDLADTGWVEWEYKNAYEATDILTKGGIPWSFVPGNHDYNNNSLYYKDDGGVVASKGGRVTDYLDKWFPVNDKTITGYYQGAYWNCDGGAGEPNGYIGIVAENYKFSNPLAVAGHSTLPGFGGVYEENSMANSYYLHDVKDRTGNVAAKYLIMNLEYQPRKSVLRWMNRIIDRYPDRRAIIVSHNIVNPDGNFLNSITGVTDVTPSVIAFNEAYTANENVFLTLSGHEISDEIMRRTDYGVNGNKITSLLIDHQDSVDPKEDTTWNQTNSSTGLAAAGYTIGAAGSGTKGNQDMISMFFVNEETKEITVRDISPENIIQGKAAGWLRQNQFSFSFADESNPTIGGAKTTLTGTVKNAVDGVVAKAKVVVDGQDKVAYTNASGSFTIENVDASKDIKLIVTKDGYEESVTEVAREKLVLDKNTSLGDVSINLPCVSTGRFGSVGNSYGDNEIKITRALDGVIFNVSGRRALSGCIELYLGVGNTAGQTVSNATNLVRIDLTGGGIIAGYTYQNGVAFNDVGLDYELYYNGADGYAGQLFVPYGWFTQYNLSLTKNDSFKIALAQYSWSGYRLTNGTDFWTAWSYEGQGVDAGSLDGYVNVGVDNTMSFAPVSERSAILSGVVTTAEYGKAAGVTVAVGEYSTLSNENGEWTLRIPLSVARSGFDIQYKGVAINAETSSVSGSWFNNYSTYEEKAILTPRFMDVTFNVSNAVGEDVNGAVVLCGSTQAVVEDGVATIENLYAGGMYQISVSKNGFLQKTITFDPADYNPDEFAFAVSYDVDLWLDYADFTGTIGGGDSVWSAYATRSATGVEYKFVSTTEFTDAEKFVLFMDTGSAVAMNPDATDYSFTICANETVTINNYAGTNTTVPADMKAKVVNSTSGATVYFTVPHSFYGGQATDVVGVSYAVYDSSGGYYGWMHSTLKGMYDSKFVRPQLPADYIRFGKNNEVYWSMSNALAAQNDVVSWQYRFGQAIPNTNNVANTTDELIYANVARSNGKLLFDFVVLQDTMDSYTHTDNVTRNTLAIRICFDVVSGHSGHQGADAVVRLYLDGTAVYKEKTSYSAAEDISWFNKSQGTTLSQGATVLKHTASTDFKGTYIHYEFDLSTFGDANATYGFHFRESYDNASGSGDIGYVNYNSGSAWTYWYYGNDSAYMRTYADGTFGWADSNTAA